MMSVALHVLGPCNTQEICCADSLVSLEQPKIRPIIKLAAAIKIVQIAATEVWGEAGNKSIRRKTYARAHTVSPKSTLHTCSMQMRSRQHDVCYFLSAARNVFILSSRKV